MRAPTPKNPPKNLDAIADIVLAYKAKPKTSSAKKGKKSAAKIAKKMTNSYDMR
jgi:hypothetical protein